MTKRSVKPRVRVQWQVRYRTIMGGDYYRGTITYFHTYYDAFAFYMELLERSDLIGKSLYCVETLPSDHPAWCVHNDQHYHHVLGDRHV